MTARSELDLTKRDESARASVGADDPTFLSQSRNSRFIGSAAETGEGATAHGATTHVPAMAIDDLGIQAVIADPAGAITGAGRFTNCVSIPRNRAWSSRRDRRLPGAAGFGGGGGFRRNP